MVNGPPPPPGLLVVLAQSQPLQGVPHRRALRAGEARHLADVCLRLAQQPREVLAIESFDILPFLFLVGALERWLRSCSAGSGAAAARTELADLDWPAVRELERDLDDVAKFPHVARPIIVL